MHSTKKTIGVLAPFALALILLAICTTASVGQAYPSLPEKAVEGSPACGDMVAVYLKVDSENQRISDIKFESYGCASNIATGSIITELAKDKTLEEAKEIFLGDEGFASEWKDFLTVTRLLQYRLHAENPKVAELLIALQSTSPFK